MKLIIIDIIGYILPSNYFIFFNNINKDLVVIREMGAYKFFLFLMLIFIFFLYILFKNSKIIFQKKHINLKMNKNWIFILIIFIFSYFLTHFSYPEYILNPYIFYKPTTVQNTFNFFSYFSLFFATNLVFYFFTNQLVKNSTISFLATIFWMTSSIHLANLYPSLMRDYLKVILFYSNYMFIIYLLKNKINEKNLHMVAASLLFMSFSFLFKADLKMLFPVYLYSLIIGLDFNIKKNLKILTIFLLVGFFFIYLTSSIYEGRNLQRFGASLSSELHLFNSKNSVGPFEDSLFFYNSCAFYSCNMLKTFIFTNFYDLHLIPLKFFHVLSEVIFMPFKYGLILEGSNIIHKIIFYKSILFSLIYKFKFLYLLLVLTLLIKSLIKGNYFLLNLLLIFFYFNFIFTLENQVRHYFFLEGISLIIFIISIVESQKLIKKIKNYAKKI